MMRTGDTRRRPGARGARREELTAAVAGKLDEMERNPDIVVLAARLGLRQVRYRTFVRPAMPPRPAAKEPDPPTAMAAPIEPPPEAPPAPTVFQPAPASQVPMPPVAAAPPVLWPFPAPTTPAAAAAPPVVFPLLAQALVHPAAEQQASGAGPAAAQPFLNLRHAVLGAAGQAKH